MIRFYIINGLPYLIGCNGDTFTVRLNEDGFTVGEKVTLPETPTVTFSELSVRAKCTVLDSITPKATEPAKGEDDTAGEQTEPEQVQDETPDSTEPAKKGRRQRKKAVE